MEFERLRSQSQQSHLNLKGWNGLLKVRRSRPATQVQCWARSAGAAAREIQSMEKWASLMPAGDIPFSLTICQTPLFPFTLSATCWRMKLLSLLSIMWSAFFFICSKLSFFPQVSEGLLPYPNSCGEGAWQRHGLTLQTHPLVEGSQAAHVCAHYPHFPILRRMWAAARPLVSGCSGILDTDMICKS